MRVAAQGDDMFHDIDRTIAERWPGQLNGTSESLTMLNHLRRASVQLSRLQAVGASVDYLSCRRHQPQSAEYVPSRLSM
jgi:hypothetical protein